MKNGVNKKKNDKALEKIILTLPNRKNRKGVFS